MQKIYKINNQFGNDQQLFQIFFRAWIDDICQNKVDYIINDTSIQVDFEKSEDASILELKGFPLELEKFITY